MQRYFIFFFKIISGLFIPNKRYSVLSQTGQVISRFSWEILQTTIGFVSALFFLFTGKVKHIQFSNGATIIQTKGKFGGFTLGNYIIGDNEISGNPNQRLFQHEYGHYLQSLKSGPVYLFKYGLPSLISSWRNG